MTGREISEKSERPKAIGAVALASLLFSTGGVLVKSIPWNPFAISFLRSVFGLLFLLIIAGKPRFTRSLPQMGGAFAYAAASILFVIALKFTASANVVLLQFTAPVYTAVLGWWILREKPSLADWGSIVVTLSGMMILFLGKLQSGTVIGDSLAVLSGVSLSLFIISLRKQKNSNRASIDTVILGNILILVITFPGIFFTRFSILHVGLAAGLGLLHMAIPFLFYTYGIMRLSGVESALFKALEPVLNPLLVYIFLGEKPDVHAFYGGALILSALTLKAFIGSGKTSTKARTG